MIRRRRETLSQPTPSGPNGRGLDEMLRLHYARLRAMASRYYRNESGYRTLQPTAIVHEAYLRLQRDGDLRWTSDGQFLAIAARVMRRVLVDAARSKGFKKRGAASARVTLVEGTALSLPKDPDVLDLDNALERLERRDPRKAALVEMRFFAGMTIDEVAQELGVSVATANREWRAARAWLGKDLERSSPDP